MTHPDLHSYQKQLLQQRDALRARLNQLRGGEPSRALASAAHFSGHEDTPAQTHTARDLELALDEHERPNCVASMPRCSAWRPALTAIAWPAAPPSPKPGCAPPRTLSAASTAKAPWKTPDAHARKVTGLVFSAALSRTRRQHRRYAP